MPGGFFAVSRKVGLMRIQVARCDKCKAEHRHEGSGMPPPEFPRKIDLEIPLKFPGLLFTRKTELCLPCRLGLQDVIKNYLGEKQ